MPLRAGTSPHIRHKLNPPGRPSSPPHIEQRIQEHWHRHLYGSHRYHHLPALDLVRRLGGQRGDSAANEYACSHEDGVRPVHSQPAMSRHNRQAEGGGQRNAGDSHAENTDLGHSLKGDPEPGQDDARTSFARSTPVSHRSTTIRYTMFPNKMSTTTATVGAGTPSSAAHPDAASRMEATASTKI